MSDLASPEGTSLIEIAIFVATPFNAPAIFAINTSFEGRLLSESEIKEIASLPSKEVLMAKIAGALNGVATKIAISINEVPSGLARSLKQYSEKSES